MPRFLTLLTTLLVAGPVTQAQIAPGELVAPKMEISGGIVYFTIQPSVSGRNYQLQYSDTMAVGTWTDVGVVRSGDDSNLLIFIPYSPAVQRRFYRVALVEATPAPAGFSLISAGNFEMGQTGIATPVHTVQLSAFYMGKYEVTWLDWQTVRDWARTSGLGYTDLGDGAGKADTYPVHDVTWYDMVKWCNAKSENEGLTPCYYTNAAQTAVFRTDATNIDNTMVKWSANGYRLPTEAEWEKAARGGLSGTLFPWGDTISHSQANYCCYSSNGFTNYYSYDVTPRPGYFINNYYHPTYAVNGQPYTSPVGSLTPNGYGLYDMTGNVWESCWDWYGSYPLASQTNPRGPSVDTHRVARGGSWIDNASSCRVTSRGYNPNPSISGHNLGFRLARTSVP